MFKPSTVVPVLLAVLLVGATACSPSDDAAKSAKLWGTCWRPFELPAGTDVTVERFPDASPPRLRMTAPAPLTVRGPGNAVIAANQALTGEVFVDGGQLDLEESDVLLRRGGVAYRMTVSDKATLVALESTAVTLRNPVVADANGKLPAGTGGSVTLGTGRLKVKVLSAVSLPPFTDAVSITPFQDVVRSKGLPSAIPRNTLSVRLKKPGTDFGASKALQVCIQTSQSPGAKPTNVPIEQIVAIDGATTDAVDVIVALAPELRPFVYDRGDVAVMLADGSFLGKDQFYLMGVVTASLIALAAVILGHVTVHRLIRGGKGSWISWFCENGKPSLSLFQIYLWTWVVLVGCVYVAVLTGEQIVITPQVLGLVGIAGLGSISARFVTSSQERTPVVASTGGFSEIFKTDGAFDLYRLQMFIFTVFTALFVVLRVVTDRAFPELDQNLLLLLGISNGIYVGSKAAAGENPFQVAGRLDVELKLLSDARAQAAAEVDRLKVRIASVDEKIKAAAGAGQPTETLDAEKKLLEKQQQDAAARVTGLVNQVAATTTARTKAIEKLQA